MTASLTAVMVAQPAVAQTTSATFMVVAKSGMTVNVGDTPRTLAGFGRRPSINDYGTVAFVGRHSNGEGLFVGRPNDIRNVNPGWSANQLRNFGDAAVLNNRSSVLARDLVAGSPPSTFLRIWEACDAALFPGAPCQADTYELIARGGNMSNADFDAVLGPPTINNDDQVAFAALDGSTTYLVTGGTPTFQKVALQPPIRPLINDQGSVIVKAGNGVADPIRLYTPGLASFEDIACPSSCRHPGFSNLGRSPGLSDDGQIVTFSGELSPGGAELAGLDPGPGIFMSIKSGGAMLLRRIAGVAGNGYLDPGEQFNDANGDDVVDPGEDVGRFSSFDNNTRVAVNDTHTVQRAVTVVFIATDLSGKKDLETSRVQMKLASKTAPVTISDAKPGAPLPLISVGQTVPGLGTVADLDLGDPLNDKGTGDIVFWAATTSGEGIIKVLNPCGLDVEYRDPDASHYINQYAAGLASDVGEPPPWIHPNLVKASDGKTRGGNACGPSSLTMLVNDHKRQRAVDAGDRLDLDAVFQETVCEFKKVNGKDVCEALAGPPEDGKNYGFSSTQAKNYLEKTLGYKEAKLADAVTLSELLAFIDENLAHGTPLLVSTTFGGSAWGKFGAGHMIEFIGRTSSGDYIVNDPAGDWFSSKTYHYNKTSCGWAAIYDKDVVRQHLVRRVSGKPVNAKGQVVSDIGHAAPRWALAVPANASADPDYISLRAHFGTDDPEYTLTVTDGQGRRAGWLPDGGQIAEIPGSETIRESFFPSEPDLGEEAPAPFSTAHVIVVENPPAGLTVEVQGPASTAYVVEGLRYAQGTRAGHFMASGALDESGKKPLDLAFSSPGPVKNFTLELSPATATNPVGTPHQVTATLTEAASNAPVANASVAFAVTGANTASGTQPTDANGTASFTYTGTAQGTDTITASYDADGDGVLEAVASATKEWVNSPPSCSGVTASPASLWPPNHKMSEVTLSGATDPDGDPVTITITGVTQDEPVNGLGDGDTAPDAQAGSASNTVLLRSERAGGGDGRVYRISYTASDGKGGTCSGTVTVGVPHDQGKGSTPVDSGAVFDSFGS